MTSSPPRADLVVVSLSHEHSPRDSWQPGPALATELERQGHVVHRVHVGAAAMEPAIAVKTLGRRLGELVGACAEPVPVVHAVGWPAAVGAMTSRAPIGGPVVVHLADLPGDSALGSWSREVASRLGWAAVRSADLVVVESHWAAEQVVDRGVPRSRVLRGLPIGDPVDEPAGWTPAPDGRPRLVAVGGIGSTAGTDVLLRALRAVPDASLVVTVPWRVSASGDLTAAHAWLGRTAAKVGVPRGAVRVDVLSDAVLADCDLVVDAARAPTSCAGILRAMARRRAVVTTDIGARAEIVDARTTGELVAPGRTDLLSRALRDVLGDPFVLEAYGDAGWERYRSAFDVRRRAGLVSQIGARLGSAA